MKAKYEKPAIHVVEFELNAAIAMCSSGYYNSADAQNCTPTGSGYDPSIMESGSFGPESECSVQVGDRCYFSASDAGSDSNVFSS